MLLAAPASPLSQELTSKVLAAIVLALTAVALASTQVALASLALASLALFLAPAPAALPPGLSSESACCVEGLATR